MTPTAISTPPQRSSGGSRIPTESCSSRPGQTTSAVEHILHSSLGLSEEEAAKLVEEAPHAVLSRLKKEKAEQVLSQLKSTGAEAEAEPLMTHKWPLPYDELTNPLAINLTAANTFILICSSVTMVLALAAIQDGKRAKGSMYLLATVLIGSMFLGVQVYEYYQLMVGHHYPPGISATGHFRPSVSLFASCFFTMTGFHGAHVTGGVILLIGDLYPVVLLQRLFPEPLRSSRAGRTVLALRRPGVDHPVHDRVLALTRHFAARNGRLTAARGRSPGGTC